MRHLHPVECVSCGTLTMRYCEHRVCDDCHASLSFADIGAAALRRLRKVFTPSHSWVCARCGDGVSSEPHVCPPFLSGAR